MDGQSNSTKRVSVNSVLYYVVLILTLLVLLVGIIGGLYYYIFFYKNRDIFPKIRNEVDEAYYQNIGYKKINITEEENVIASYFLPVEWVNIDQGIGTYVDVLSGSLSYFMVLPNGIGILTNDVCDRYTTELDSKLRRSTLYTNVSFVNKGIKEFSKANTCFIEHEAKISVKDYYIRQISFFTKERIFLFFIQVSKDLSTHVETMNLISESIYIS